MTPAARLAAAIEVLDAFADARAPIDKTLARWGRENRYAGSKDRAAIADRVYDVLRRWRSYGAVGGATGRGRVLASLRAEGLSGDEIAALFSGAAHAPAPLSAQEAARIEAAARPEAGPPSLTADVAGDWPDWLWPELARSGLDPSAEAAAQRRRAPLDLRVNALKARREEALAALAEDGLGADPGPLSPSCLRLAPTRALQRSRAFQDGRVEPQDAASQAAALLSGATPGLRVLDFCAGGGGKTLALAAMMRNEGRLVAHDVAPQRMVDIPPRAARAGARVEVLSSRDLGRDGALFDLVVVDAPCSGSGAWARHPDGKWRLTPARLNALCAAQGEALAAAAALVGPGGALVYITCSLLPIENAAQVAAFLETKGAAAFTPEPIAPVWRAQGVLGSPPAASDAATTFTPARHGADGFFIARFRRRK